MWTFRTSAAALGTCDVEIRTYSVAGDNDLHTASYETHNGRLLSGLT